MGKTFFVPDAIERLEKNGRYVVLTREQAEDVLQMHDKLEWAEGTEDLDRLARYIRSKLDV